MTSPQLGLPLPASSDDRAAVLTAAQLVASGGLEFCQRVRAEVGQGVALEPGPSELLRRARRLVEPPTADPHVGWCGGWGLETPGYPIRRHAQPAASCLAFVPKKRCCGPSGGRCTSPALRCRLGSASTRARGGQMRTSAKQQTLLQTLRH
jgi:hypothetical protein